MRMKPYDERDGYRVWLSGDELERLIETMYDKGGTSHRIAGRLGGHCGLRRDEASKSRPIDIVESHGECVLRVWEDQSKGEKYRETPIPKDLADQIQMIPEFRDQSVDDAVLDVSAKTLNRWVKHACETLYADSGDEAWTYVTYHDLRRTWGTRMLETGVLPSVVMWHGGWNDWETFREHYLGEFSPAALARERSKVEWLGGESEGREEQHVTTAAPPASGAQYRSD